jgi:aminodeoxyfutalosine deaminase
LYVTINSDDPPMFNTSLTQEFQRTQASYGWERETIEQLVLNAVDATLLPETERAEMRRDFEIAFERFKK